MPPLSDPTLVDLIGDLANYIGAPGPSVSPATAGGAQHPFQPLLATLLGSVLTVGGDGQRCILVSSDGIPNPCIDITAQMFTIASNATSPQTRVDLIVGQANFDDLTGRLDATSATSRELRALVHRLRRQLTRRPSYRLSWRHSQRHRVTETFR